MLVIVERYRTTTATQPQPTNLNRDKDNDDIMSATTRPLRSASSGILLLPFLLLGSALAFAPPLPTSSRLVMRPSRPWSSMLSSSSSEATVDTFDAYEQTDAQPTLAVRDVTVGSGDDVAEEGNLVTIVYNARLMATGNQFDFGTSFVCRLGEGNVIPGLDQGLVVSCGLWRVPLPASGPCMRLCVMTTREYHPIREQHVLVCFD
jgi:hypothetical protein